MCGLLDVIMPTFTVACLFALVSRLSKLVYFRMCLNVVLGIVAAFTMYLASVLNPVNCYGSWLLLYNHAMVPITT